MNAASPALIVFEIPGEPVGKGRPIAGKSFSGFTTMRTPTKTLHYEGLVAWMGKQAMAGRAPLEGALWMHLTAFFQIPKSASKKVRAGILDGSVVGYVTKKPDASNIIKSVEDGLNGIAYADDSQLSDVRIIRRYSDRPRVVVSIGSLDDKTALCHDARPKQGM